MLTRNSFRDNCKLFSLSVSLSLHLCLSFCLSVSLSLSFCLSVNFKHDSDVEMSVIRTLKSAYKT